MDFQTHIGSLNLNFDVLDINIVRSSDGRESFPSYSLARKSKDSIAAKRLLFKVNEAVTPPNSGTGRLMINLHNPELTTSDIWNLYSDIDSIYKDPYITTSRNKPIIRDFLMSFIISLYDKKNQILNVIDYFDGLVLNFIVREIIIINQDELTNIPYLSYDIYDKRDRLLFSVMEFNAGFPNPGKQKILTVHVSELTNDDLSNLRSDIDTIYNYSDDIKPKIELTSDMDRINDMDRIYNERDKLKDIFKLKAN